MSSTGVKLLDSRSGRCSGTATLSIAQATNLIVGLHPKQMQKSSTNSSASLPPCPPVSFAGAYEASRPFLCSHPPVSASPEPPLQWAYERPSSRPRQPFCLA